MTTKKKKLTSHDFIEKLVGPLTLGKAIEAIRLADEITQIEFAKKLHISPSHLCDIEKGRKIIGPKRAATFAKILGYSDRYFVMLSLQEMLDDAGLKMKIRVDAA